MARAERVLIVGGGMAGLSLTIALRQRGLSANIGNLNFRIVLATSADRPLCSAISSDRSWPRAV
jgi:2-polyprenyl-6-methoxyphenol hydroxylase-like FAD-dependent oxidoreductase